MSFFYADIKSDEIQTTSSIKIKEISSAPNDTAAYGQLWVKTATPNELYFTTDAGDDIQITSGTSLAGGGGGSTAADDISTGDAAVTIATSSGDITIDAQATDADIIFKGTDGGSDITALTLDMSEGGKLILPVFTSGSGPGSETDTGIAGTTFISADGINYYLFICVATNQWTKIQLTW